LAYLIKLLSATNYFNIPVASYNVSGIIGTNLTGFDTARFGSVAFGWAWQSEDWLGWVWLGKELETVDRAF
jgi:hypothetical protein